MTTTKHTRTIERTDDGSEPDTREYALSCACGTLYVSRLSSRADADRIMVSHLADVAEGLWSREIVAEAARMALLAPLHNAQREVADLTSDYRSAGFAVLVAQQHDGDVELAKAERVSIDADLLAARARLAELAD